MRYLFRGLGLPALLSALIFALPAVVWAQGEAVDDADADDAPGAEAPATESTEEDEEAEDGPAAAPAAPAEDAEVSIFRELKTVESDVNDLKEKVFRSKARLLLLEEKVIRGVVSGAKGVVRHLNTLGSAYALESITYYFDGNPVYQATDAATQGTLSKQKEIEIFEANIPPGNHTLSVSGVIRGRGTGLFAYLADYSFEFSSSYSFVAADGKTTRVDAALFKKGGPLADYVEGPAVEFRDRAEKGEESSAKPVDSVPAD